MGWAEEGCVVVWGEGGVGVGGGGGNPRPSCCDKALSRDEDCLAATAARQACENQCASRLIGRDRSLPREAIGFNSPSVSRAK